MLSVTQAIWQLDMMMMNWIGHERTSFWSHLGYYPSFFQEELQTTIKTNSQDSRCPSRATNHQYFEYKSEAFGSGISFLQN
jgi:hypothetical protein